MNENEEMIQAIRDIAMLLGDVPAEHQSGPVTLEADKIYVARTRSGSTYEYNALEDTLTVKSGSMGDFTARGHFIGVDTIFSGIVPGQLLAEQRIALLYEGDDGKQKYISTSGMTSLLIQDAV